MKNGILFSLQYIQKTIAYPREHEQLKDLRNATVDKYKSRYESSNVHFFNNLYSYI